MTKQINVEKEREAHQRGLVAERLLNDKVVEEAFRAVETMWIEDMLAAGPEDDLLRFRLSAKISAIREAWQMMKTFSTTAKMIDGRREDRQKEAARS